jgi:hypothetical protein
VIDLKTRERKLIALCAAIVLVALIHFLIVSKVLEKRDTLRRSISRAHIQLKDLKLLQTEYDQILAETKRIKQRVDGRGRSFELFSFLDQTAKNLDLMNNLTGLKPSRRTLGDDLTEDIVDMEVKGISLENLVAYLYEIESAHGGIAIASIRIRQESQMSGGLDVSMLVTSLNSS